ncbi:cytochrome bc1 complex diheme cytochrome c subunit [Capillimicrobium parvum]|uniref:cytochrome bc1 complex diheme cytochrome c subunit n=1 Tax=Capillimicrobium parvum TaxID=2884022 RepID=UPI00216B2371|nr:c-type cytochrome [Capillimicrobium parvum]
MLAVALLAGAYGTAAFAQGSSGGQGGGGATAAFAQGSSGGQGGGGATAAFAQGSSGGGVGGATATNAPITGRGDVAAGRRLFLSGCASCHGDDARGIANRAPNLHGAGAQAADFYLRTGRMPLSEPDDQPVRAPVQYTEREIRQLVAYVGSLGGPPIPRVDPAAGDLARGREVFTSNCAGCHQIVARGGIVTGATAPPLQDATPTQIAESVRTGPYLMPNFSERQISDADLDSVVRYVLWTRAPDNAGGWGIGNIGPIPEGMVAWLIAIVALIGVARLIGERTP